MTEDLPALVVDASVALEWAIRADEGALWRIEPSIQAGLAARSYHALAGRTRAFSGGAMARHRLITEAAQVEPCPRNRRPTRRGEVMVLALTAEPPPMQADREGVLRVAGTRVTLDTVVGAFNAGATPEEIALRYDPLPLADVYSVLGYYLRHRAELDAYLAERQRRGDARQAEAETRMPWSEVRARLLARQRLADPITGV